MEDRISFDIFNKNKKKTQETNDRDADEIKVTGAIVTTNKGMRVKTKKNVTQTDTWGEGADIKALEGASMEDMPAPKKTSGGKFTNSKKRNINWNSKLDTVPEKPKAPSKVGTWGTETKTKSQWGASSNVKSKDTFVWEEPRKINCKTRRSKSNLD
jgi:hypothetical protein